METIGENMLILAQDQYYSLNNFETRLNSNVLIVGTSGAGKTRSIVEPNILQAVGSYIISDPKGNLYARYKEYLENLSYRVIKLEFTDPRNSEHYNFFHYIRDTQDILKVAHMLVYPEKTDKTIDPFWDSAAQLLLQSLIAYVMETMPPEAWTLESIMTLICMCEIEENDASCETPLDILMEGRKREDKDAYSVKTYRKFRIAAGRTLRSIMITLFARLGLFDVPEINELLKTDSIDIPSIGKEKTALFVVVSDTDRSLDVLVNVFFTQAMNELCRFADKECKDNRLPVSTRFIMDDFGTNCVISGLDRAIASIRSREISMMLMIQAESQLFQAYGDNGRTIRGCCDSFVYLGGSDIETARSVAERADLPVKRIMNMPIGECWVFRRGQQPINAKIFDLESFKRYKMTNQKRRENRAK